MEHKEGSMLPRAIFTLVRKPHLWGRIKIEKGQYGNNKYENVKSGIVQYEKLLMIDLWIVEITYIWKTKEKKLSTQSCVDSDIR